MSQAKARMTVVLLLAGLPVAACGGASLTTKVEAATLEQIQGTDISRVILTAEAAQRLAIATVPVRMEEVVRKRWFGAEVVSRPTGAPAGAESWIRVDVTDSERSVLDLSQPAFVFPLSDGGQTGPSGWTVQAAGRDIREDADLSGGLYYTTEGTSPHLAPGTSVLIELRLSGTEQLIVPYSSVIYDPLGQTWTYTNPESLVFIRHSISIDYIDGDEAFLSDGPPPGTQVVTVGAGELSGFEAGIGN